MNLLTEFNITVFHKNAWTAWIFATALQTWYMHCIPIQKKYSDSIRFSETNQLIQFDSAHHCHIDYYRLLRCQMSTLLRHLESLSQLHKDVGRDVSYNNWAERCYIK